MDSGSALLSLLQLSDSFFPSGGFAYSWGLETAISEGEVSGVEGLDTFLHAHLRGQIARSDALAAKLAFAASARNDLKAVIRLDQRINAMKTARECREGSIQIGRQILKVINHLHHIPLLREFAAGVTAHAARGHHAPVFGMTCQALGISQHACIQAYLYQAALGIVSAGVRMVPLGHMDGQGALERVKPVLAAIGTEIEPLEEEDMASFAPGVEIRAMRHETLYTRMFRS